MSSVAYDLDTSGGLMPLIRALIKPPDEEGNGQKTKKPQHPYYKRPGKGHNHDSCDACGEGGDLICCDRCPASFHLGCYDPPLDENDIPAGLWLCRECKASDAEKPASSRGSRAVSPADTKSDTEKKTRTLRNRSNSKKRSKDDSDEEEEIKEKEEEPELTPMEVLVRAAKIMNPTQFQLPKQMQVPCVFPGTDKEGTKNSTASVVTTDSYGCVPLPAKSCYVCLLTCKHAPLLQCDYCPLLFHLDCLDPPLTALPTGRWMCPNHVEKYIDWKLVNSISLTERVALWDRFQAPIDQHAIKIEFIRRARNPAPRFRMKVPVSSRGRVAVPEMVKMHYASPPPLLPSRREHVRCTNALKRLKAAGVYSESEDEDAPKHTICLNLTCPEYTGAGDCEHSYTKKYRGERVEDRASQETKERRQSEDKTDDEQMKMELTSECSSELSDSEPELAAPRRRPRAPSPPRARAAAAADELLAHVDHQLRNLDHKLVRILAWQRLQQVLAGEQAHGSFRHAGLGGAAARAVAAALGARRGAHVPPSELLSGADRARIAAATERRRVHHVRAADPDAARARDGGHGQRVRRAPRPGLPRRQHAPRRHLHGRGDASLRADQLLRVRVGGERRDVRVRRDARRRAARRRRRGARRGAARRRARQDAGAAQSERLRDGGAGGQRGGRVPLSRGRRRRRVGGLRAGAARRAAAVRLPRLRVQHHRLAARGQGPVREALV